MSVIAENIPAAPITPAVPDAPALTVEQEIAAINAEAARINGHGPESDMPEDDGAYVEDIPVEVLAEEVKDDTEAEAKPAETKKDDEAAAAEEAITFDPAAETPETYLEKKTKLAETYELPSEVQSLIDYQEAKLAEAQAAIGEIDAFGNKEQTIKIASAFDQLFERKLDEVTGLPVPNVKPVIDLLRSDYRAEFAPLANQIFEADSTKYQGSSVFEEILVDKYGSDKVKAVAEFLAADEPLPVTPPELRVPPIVNPQSKEAYWQLPEVKRFELTSLVEEVAQLKEDLADPTEYDKDTIHAELQKAEAKLKYELQAIDRDQSQINSERQRAETEKRQAAESQMEFRNEVNTSYNTEIFEMADTFAKNLAPKLTFADDDTQLSQARNIMTRVHNALAFAINGDGSIADDPTAEYYAKQLSEEGIKADWSKARNLLKNHYKAVELVESLKRDKTTSKPALEKALRDKNRLMADIKAEEISLLGQISTKYVKSNSSAITKQAEALKGKKQIARITPNGKPDSRSNGKPPTMQDVDREIARINAEAASRIKNGEDLVEYYRS